MIILTVDKKCIEKHQIIINCTPLGTYPKIDSFPEIPYQFLSQEHILYDLVYNPEISRFLSYEKRKLHNKKWNGNANYSSRTCMEHMERVKITLINIFNVKFA